jgi:hypothetical protein
LGDINIDFLKYVSHPKTEEYLDMLYDCKLLPLITKPTRITNYTSTLTDHICINIPTHQTISGIVTVDISDHLPVFCIVDNFVKKNRGEKYFRDFSNFDQNQHVSDVTCTDWDSIGNHDIDLHSKTKLFLDSLIEIINKHAPMKKIPRNKLKQKPWITNGLLKSIKVTLTRLTDMWQIYVTVL